MCLIRLCGPQTSTFSFIHAAQLVSLNVVLLTCNAPVELVRDLAQHVNCYGSRSLVGDEETLPRIVVILQTLGLLHLQSVPHGSIRLLWTLTIHAYSLHTLSQIFLLSN